MRSVGRIVGLTVLLAAWSSGWAEDWHWNQYPYAAFGSPTGVAATPITIPRPIYALPRPGTWLRPAPGATPVPIPGPAWYPSAMPHYHPMRPAQGYGMRYGTAGGTGRANSIGLGGSKQPVPKAYPSVPGTYPSMPKTDPSVPVPYPDMDHAGGGPSTNTVTVETRQPAGSDPGLFKRSTGDEAGTQSDGKGVVAHATSSEATFGTESLAGSKDDNRSSNGNAGHSSNAGTGSDSADDSKTEKQSGSEKETKEAAKDTDKDGTAQASTLGDDSGASPSEESRQEANVVYGAAERSRVWGDLTQDQGGPRVRAYNPVVDPMARQTGRTGAETAAAGYGDNETQSPDSSEAMIVKRPGAGLLPPSVQGPDESAPQVILPKGFHVIDPK